MDKPPLDRKEKHVRICLEKDVESSLTAGFEKYTLINQPIPDFSLEDVDLSSAFLGKKISAPFVISPITGGTEISREINRNLAKAAQELGVIMSVGSQKLALEDRSRIPTYQVRDVAPDIPLLANLGAIYLNYGFGLDECKRAVEMIQADGLVFYLNPLQKMMQGKSDLDFRGLIQKISGICKGLEVPVIVKEVGFGLSPSAALLLKEAGVWALDVAGAGGTSWAKIERFVQEEASPRHPLGSTFDTWGTPTVESLVSLLEAVGDIPIIASGGVRTGLDMAKALALGASYVGMALPLLAPAMESSEAVKGKIQTILDQFRIAMFCSGNKNLEEIRKGNCIREIKR